ncbi:MAG: helix-turn-helix domain-containing protein [Acidobacteria bacterium]|nr:helix-turn-helix domain-containing protein [Acidobacteriota bacterium]
MIENLQLKLAYDYVQWTGENIFLTGKAGTGKTTFLHNLKGHCTKRMIVVAPTGVAALNAGGVTIHSFFQMPFGPWIPSTSLNRTNSEGRTVVGKFNRNKINIIKGLDLLVIDEISMVRADLLDGIDAVLRQYRDRHRPFGGVQLLMIGDLRQLAPVVKKEDWAILSRYYKNGFFFSSMALQQARFIGIELKHIYRQSDPRFIALLNNVRENRMDIETCKALNRRYQPDFIPDDKQGFITMTTHNIQARRINETKLAELTGTVRNFQATVSGDFPDYLYPTDLNLQLKIGAQVMFVKNDSSTEKRYYNGKIGTLVGFENDCIRVRCPGEDECVAVEPVLWDNAKYTLDEETKEIREEIAGTFTQIPLKLAWAITIHKSQGLTFDRAIIDAQAAFAHGQVYVALSRCRTLEGLVLSTPIQARAVKTDTEVLAFTSDIENNPPDPQQLFTAKHDYQRTLLLNLFDFQSFHRGLRRIIRLAREHASALPENPVPRLVEIDRNVREHISIVAEKFHAQIHILIADQIVDLESNDALQERIRKGTRYFSEKIRDLLMNPLESLTIETDNKAVRKSLEKAINQLTDQVKLQSACLEACSSGFSVKTYLKVRAETAMDGTGGRKRKKTGTPEQAADVAHPELYKRLKAWRQQKAHQEGVALNTILGLKVMIDIANRAPATRQQLKRIRGMGKKTLERVGDDLLDILSDYGSSDQYPEETKEIRNKSKSSPTRQISLDMFNEGKTIAEIASVRGLVEVTIEGHLAHFVRNGTLPLERFITIEKALPAMEYFKTAESLFLSPAKERFGNTYSYCELKMIVQHLIHTGAVQTPD